MAQAHAPDGLPPQLPPIPAMPGVASASAPDGGAVSDADLDKHMIAKGLARLPEPHSDADLELLWRTLSNEVREFLRHLRPDIVIAIAERTSNIVLIRRIPFTRTLRAVPTPDACWLANSFRRSSRGDYADPENHCR
jgi:hypothetical protein